MRPSPGSAGRSSRPVRAGLLAILLLTALGTACSERDGRSPRRVPESPTAPSPGTHVTAITDGDTVRVSPPVSGATAVRFLNIDAPELTGSTQEPWASSSRSALAALIPPGTGVTIQTDRTTHDTFGRLLGLVQRADSLDVNREQLRQGHAILYVLWPNVARFESYRAAQIEAQDAGRGVWAAAAMLVEMPFEYRLRIDGAMPTRPVGDYVTRRFVPGADYRLVHINNRVFFASDTEAVGAGFLGCPRDGAGYAIICFAPGR